MMNPYIQLQTWWLSLKQQYLHIKTWCVSIKQKMLANLDAMLSSVFSFWRRLNVAQRCYCVATLLMVVALYFDITSVVFQMIVYGVVLAGLISEFWPRFMLVWNSLPGKTFIFIVYAVIANFALASASGLVNDVTGVAAHNMPYSHNFAIILVMPSWFFMTTVLALVLVQLLMPVYLILLLILKPFGIHGLWHAPNYRFVFSTALVRYIWMLVLLTKILEVSAQTGIIDFLSNAEPRDTAVINTDKKSLSEGQNNSKENGVDERVESLQQEVISAAMDELRQVKALEDDSVEENDFVTNLAQHSVNFRTMQKHLLAEFIFYYEADERSRCRHGEDTKVIELNDYEILLISESKDSELGYNYQVVPCHSPAIGQSVFPDN